MRCHSIRKDIVISANVIACKILRLSILRHFEIRIMAFAQRLRGNLKGNGDLKIYLSSIIVIPALVEALSIYKNDEQEYNEYRWYRRITKFLEESDLKIDDQRGLYYIANQLLRNSLGNSFKNLENFYMQGQKE